MQADAHLLFHIVTCCHGWVAVCVCVCLSFSLSLYITCFDLYRECACVVWIRVCMHMCVVYVYVLSENAFCDAELRCKLRCCTK